MEGKKKKARKANVNKNMSVLLVPTGVTAVVDASVHRRGCV